MAPGYALLNRAQSTCLLRLAPQEMEGCLPNGTPPIYILEPGSSIISDILTFTSDGRGGENISFTSDVDETLGLGTYVSGSSLTENGNVQLGYSIVWNLDTGGTFTDQIFFQSDIADSTSTGSKVPEPMSLAMFGAGLIGLGALRRRRSKARV